MIAHSLSFPFAPSPSPGFGLSLLPSHYLVDFAGPSGAIFLRYLFLVINIAAFAFRFGNFYFMVGLFCLVCDLLRLKVGEGGGCGRPRITGKPGRISGTF